MAEPTRQELETLVTELRAENDRLRAEIGAQPPPGAGAPAPPRRRGGWGRTLAATVLVVIGALLAPVAVTAAWARTELTNTDTFVATFAPLADDPAVQSFVTDEVVAAVDERVDIPKLTADLVDGLQGLGLGPNATAALQALEGPAARGLQGLVQNVVSRFVTSDAFATAWEQALRVSHRQLVATMQGNANAAVTVGPGGEIGIQLGPIVAQVKTRLVQAGVTFAEKIPQVDKTIVIGTSDAVVTAQRYYGLVVTLGAWLPWIVLAILAAGVLVARRRALALVWAAIALGVSMLLLGLALVVGRSVAVGELSPAHLPADAATAILDQTTEFLRNTAVVVTVLAAAVAIVTWLTGPFGLPRRMQAAAGRGAAAVRAAGERHRLSTGRVGEWLYRWRTPLRAVIAAGGSAIVLFVRPLSPALIIWTALAALAAVGVLVLLERPPTPAATAPRVPV